MNLVRTENGLQVHEGGIPDDREFPKGQGSHPNSKQSFHSLVDLSSRQTVVYAILAEYGSMTDREVLNEMSGIDMNQVRPRITELIHMGWVQEIGKVFDPLTQRRVRVVKAITERQRWEDAHQMELGIRSW